MAGKSFPHFMPMEQHNIAGWVCAWPGNNRLLPIQNEFGASFVLHVICLNDVTHGKGDKCHEGSKIQFLVFSIFE
jgi:hypothetical protein